VSRFARTFDRLGSSGECGLFPYLTAGFPDLKTSHALVEAALDAGADGFEIGVPFSDPLADGATLQRANARALEAGATLDTALDLVQTIRRRSFDVPVALMSYYNPLRQRGEAQLASELAEVQADGVIAADLPPEEASELRAALAAHDLGLVPFVAPTSPPARIRAIAELDPPFVYCITLVGVTGARQDLSSRVGDLLQRMRQATSAPLVVGFGISQPRHVKEAAELGAAGVIVGGALADLIERSTDPVGAVRTYLRELKEASRLGSPTPAAS